jgi:hypothetical protein
MSINYNSIRDLVNLLYDFVYSKDKTTYQNYIYEKLNPESITLNDLIKTNVDYQVILSNSFGEKENFKLMANLFSGLVKKVALKKYFKDFPLTLIIQQHNDKYKDSVSVVDIYYELFINQLISELVILDNIPFYLLNICNFNLDYIQIKDNSDYNSLVIKEFGILDQTDLDKKFCFSIYEHYNSYKTLADLLSDELEHEDLYNLFFQVFFTHAYLNYKFGSFRHGSFNIYSFLVSNQEYEVLNLKIGDKKLFIKNVKFICKLFNYRRTEVKGFPNKSVHYSDLENPTYDLYIFFKSLYDFSKKIDKNFEKIKIIISNFISIDIIEKKIMNEDEFYNTYSDTIIPIHILFKNNFFSSSINMSGNSRSIFAKNRDSNKEKDTTGEHSLTEVYSGYRNLGRSSSYQSGGKKKGSKSGKKKTTLGKKKLSRERAIVDEEVSEEVDNVDTLVDDEIAEDNEFVKRMNRRELREEAEEVETRKINPDVENQNDELMTEGDDDREKVPLDHDIENGMRKYKNKSKKSKSKKQDSSSSSSLDLTDLDGGSESEEQPKAKNTGSNASSAQMMLPDSNNLQMMAKQKTGSNKNFNSIFQNLNKGQMIPLLPEMQGMFDINTIAQQQAQAMNQGQIDFSTEEPNGSEPRVMDMGLMNSGMGQFGGPMSQMQMGPLGMALGAPTMAPPSMGMGGQFGHLGSAGMGNMPNLSQLTQMAPMPQMGQMGQFSGLGSMAGFSEFGAGSGPAGSDGAGSGPAGFNGVSAPAVPTAEVSAPSAATGLAPIPEINTSVPSMNGGSKKKKNFFLSRI